VSWVQSCANLAEAANLPSITAHRWREVDPDIRHAATEQGIPYELLAALFFVESRFNPYAVSPANAQGLAQTIPSTGNYLASQLAIPYDPFNARASARMGALYLRRMLDRFGWDFDPSIAAYNAGPGAVTKHGGVPPFKETQAYVPAVRRAMRAIKHSEGRCTAFECPPDSSCPPSILPRWRPAPYGFSPGSSSAPSRPRRSRPSQSSPTVSTSASAWPVLVGLVGLALIARGSRNG
jgi:hypothetical protein